MAFRNLSISKSCFGIRLILTARLVLNFNTNSVSLSYGFQELSTQIFSCGLLNSLPELF